MTGGIDARVYSLDEIGSNKLDVVVCFRRLYLELCDCV